ncbi:MAG TPA: sialidase family protein [Candidatus Krumholzibacteria bacterium]|nr:sialidase family protein [Candidatus Krumholzibacteria bacterium]HPD70631.1 sialidase family protein [Candidatus Krumholzibacteria bacterium]HRY39669.1 sialidase family protein [Candidatus Krumholzibacteria bacterium]
MSGSRRPAARRGQLVPVLVGLLLGGCQADRIPAPAPGALVEQTLFTSGEGGYDTYRIPALLTTQAGTALAFSEGRRNSRRDHGDIDILLRRSTDGGRTWSPPQVVVDLGPDTCGNPTAVEDRETGTVWLAFCWNLADDEENLVIRGDSRDTRRAFVTASADEGVNWSPPREITEGVKSAEMRWYATGPGIGIQIRHGPDRGRLVVPGDHSYPASDGDLRGARAAFGAHAIVSDDHGASWRLEGVIRPGVGEPQVAELADPPGRLLANLRSYAGRSRRAQATSDDGGASWTAPRDQRRLVEPVCQASLLRYSWPGEPTGDLLVFSNPASRRRENLVLRASADGGASWPRALVIHSGAAAYSCLARFPDGRIGCLYEGGDTDPYERIVLATLPVAALIGDGLR